MLKNPTANILTRADIPEFDRLITRARDEKGSCPSGVGGIIHRRRRCVSCHGVVNWRLGGIRSPSDAFNHVIVLS